MLPFVAMLLAIATLPLLVPRWWEPNRNKPVVSSVLGLPVLALYLERQPLALLRMGEEYVSFILLLAGLYVISGGILLRGDLEATPLTNTAFLTGGSVLASFIGTTGAAMLLIRPLLQTNRERSRVKHTVIFFILLVCNIGGMLTPLGDPPLFLGYLQGVPFAWTFTLWGPWLLMVTPLLLVYFIWDSIEHAREPLAALRRDRAQIEPLRVLGAVNALWLVGVVLAVALLRAPWREAVIVGVGALSLWATPSRIRRANGFTAYPMVEVAVQFFWATGILSSFLDNAPTYLTLLALGRGLGLADEVAGVPHAILTGISLGAVAGGANTYIGNAPNFMVKSIAEEAGVKMPSFHGYLIYSVSLLIPLFAGITFLFFH